jgi:hypothetical protein
MALDDQPVDWSGFFQAYSGIRLTIKKDECQIFLPQYANLSHSQTERTSGGMESVPTSGTAMSFQDEWSSKSFILAGEPERLNKVFLRDLWEYPEQNIRWDDFNEVLSFQDVDVKETSLEDFVKDLDSFLVFHKLSKFGDVWWVGRVKTTLQGDASAFVNVTIPNMSGSGVVPTNTIEFWSPDKYVNDEYKRYVSNPSTYTGFLTSSDFQTGGWFSIPDLNISSKPFEKLKIAEVLLNLNFTFDPDPYFGHFYSIDSTIGARIKDSTSIQILDTSQNKIPQNKKVSSDTLISHWMGALISTDNIPTLGTVGDFEDDACETKQNEINFTEEETNENAISHSFDAQITVKPDYTSAERAFLGTIDPINWRSADTDETQNPHEIGALNIDRAFGGASGDIDNGIIAGGVRTNMGNVGVLSSTEIWQGNAFIRNVLVEMNTPRCFHIQGGTGSSSCAVIGGFSSMNTSDFRQFSRYGKTDVKGNIEYYITNDDPNLASFKTISTYTMTVPRGEAGGVLEVRTETRQDKFEVEEIIKNFNITPDDEETILKFVNDESQDIVNDVPVPSNFRRYNVTNIEGFVYGGNKTGKVYLLDMPENDDIIDTFESINATHVDVSQQVTEEESGNKTLEEYLQTEIDDIPESIRENIVTIPGEDDSGKEITLAECGKYRLEFIEGAYNFSGAKNGEVIQNIIVVEADDEQGVDVTLPYTGTYRIDYIDGAYFVGTNPQYNHDITVNGNNAGGTIINLEACGFYEFEITSGYVDNISGASVSAIEINKIGGLWTTVIDSGIVPSSGAFEAIAGVTHTECIRASGPLAVRFPSKYGFSGSGSMDVKIRYRGSSEECRVCGTTTTAIYTNGNFSTYVFENDLESYEFCGQKGSIVRFFIPGAQDTNNGAINARLTYVNSSCVNTSADVYGSLTDVYVNEVYKGRAFDSGHHNSVAEVESYNEARPTKQKFDFCVETENSVLKMIPKDEFDEDYDNNGGNLNLRILYLGESDCGCYALNENPFDTETSSVTVTDTDVTIIHTQTDPTKNYPLRCHGMSYVGDKDAGLSTGGRTEYNRIYDVECRIKEKYGLGATNSCSGGYSSNPLEHDRVLDLVYEWNGFTWIRRQNLFESVYYHVGVGDESNAIFWGGIHDTVGDFNFSYTVDPSGAESLPISAFFCEDTRDSNLVEELFGRNYESIEELEESECWFIPTWENEGVITGSKTSDPSYKPGEATLAHAKDPNFPEFAVVSVGPTNPTSLTSQPSKTTSYTVTSTTSLEARINYQEGSKGEFVAISFLLNEDDTVSSNRVDGTLFIERVNELRIAGLVDLYPEGCAACGILDIEFTDIQVIAGGQAILYYSYNQEDTSSGFKMTGFGQILFDSMQDIWMSIANGTSIEATNHIFTIQENTEYPDSEGETVEGSARLTFDATDEDTVFIGVRNRRDIWNAENANCGPDVRKYISFDADYSIEDEQRWGTPLWASGLVEDISGLFKLGYDYNRSLNNSDMNGGVNEFETTRIGMQADDLASIINNRILILGNTVSQDHEFNAINNSTLTYDITSCFACSALSKCLSGDIFDYTMQKSDFGGGDQVVRIEDIEFLCDEYKEKIREWNAANPSQKIEYAVVKSGGFLPNLFASYPQLECFRWIRLQFFPPAFFLETSLPYTSLTAPTSSVSSLSLPASAGLLTIFNFANYPDSCPEWSIDVDTVVPTSSLCEGITASATTSTSAESVSAATGYSEWASSFIQEYYSDERYNLPQRFIPSNSFSIKGDNQPLSYRPSRWRRWMDGVGLGGDVPDYDSIVDDDENERPPSQWQNIGSWYVGQMAFGDPNGAIIVGGHKVDPNIIHVGIHAHETDTRLFKWDLTDIPPEDTYLTNYLGRRFWTYHVDENGLLVPADTQSSFGITIFNAEQKLNVERHGRAIFNGSSSESVTFSESMPSEIGDNYSVSLIPNDNIQTWWSDKTSNGFTINVEIDNWVGEVDYIVSAETFVTEEDIEDLDDLDGYIFDK